MPPKPLTLDGLTADVPRAARFTARVQATRLLLLLASVLVASASCLWAAQDLRDLSALAAHGRTAVAQVTGKHTAGNLAGSKSPIYFVDYTFHADGTQVDDQYQVGQAEYERPLPSAPMLVTFLPSDPLTHRLGAVTRGRVQDELVTWILRGLGGGVLLGVLLTVREVPLRRNLKLLRDGSLAAGTITYCDKGKREVYCIVYEFTVDGWLSPKTIIGSQSFRERVEKGSTMAILYDPARPSRNIPYRMLTGVALARPRQ